MDEQPTGAIRRTIDSVAEDQRRRSEILRKLTNALKLYLESCSRERDVESDTVAELLGTACRGFYDSLAAGYLAIEPPVDPQYLFGISGELFGGRTLVEFEKAVTVIKIRRPDRWPPPQMGREGDSLEMFRAFNKLSKNLHRDFRLGPLLDGGWLNEWVAEGVKHWKPQFEHRFEASAPISAKDHALRDTHQEPKSGGRPKELIAIDPAKVIELRGRKSKRTFARRCGLSEDTVERVERDGMASKKTINAICKYAKSQGITLRPDDLKNLPQ